MPASTLSQIFRLGACCASSNVNFRSFYAFCEDLFFWLSCLFVFNKFPYFYTVTYLKLSKTMVDILSCFSLSCHSFFCVLLYILNSSITVSYWLFSLHTDVFSLLMSSLKAKLYLHLNMHKPLSLEINKTLKGMIFWSLLLLQVS